MRCVASLVFYSILVELWDFYSSHNSQLTKIADFQNKLFGFVELTILHDLHLFWLFRKTNMVNEFL